MKLFFSTGEFVWPGIRVAQPCLDVGVLEVEEMARVVPDEAVLLDRLALAADLRVGLEDDVVVVACSERRGRGGETGDAAPTMSVRGAVYGRGSL